MGVYQRNPNAAADDLFEAGDLTHLVVGQTGRLLDPRRTPVTIVRVEPETGSFVVRIDDFEDRGAEWIVPMEKVWHYQFTRNGPTTTEGDTAVFAEAVRRFKQALHVTADAATVRHTTRRLAEETERATTWLAARQGWAPGDPPLPDPETRRGLPEVQRALTDYLDARGVLDLERAFARTFVSNPGSGELVKGHRIVFAELGLVDFEGTVVRDPSTFAGRGAKPHRGDHIVARLGFLRAFLGGAGLRTIILYRGMSTMGPIEPDTNRTFVSASFSRAVAESHFDSTGPESIGVLYRQAVPVERIFMTYLETAEMNQQFLEAEAVLLWMPIGERPF